MIKSILRYLFLCVLCIGLFSCSQQISKNRVYINKAAQKSYTKAEQFVQQHFENYEVDRKVLFEFHVIYFNDNDAFTISKLGAYNSIATFAADKQLLYQITENLKQSYTGYIMLRNYDLYKEIEILDETDVLFYFPDVVKMQADYRTKAFYELDNYVQAYLNKDIAEENAFVLWAIPVVNKTLMFDEKVAVGKGLSTKEILLDAFQNDLPIIEDAIYVELAPRQILQNYRIVDLYNELQAIKNYLENNKTNQEAIAILKTLKEKQVNLSNEFSKLNKQLLSVNENETNLKQMLNAIQKKIDN